jgi:hypothetical protein
MVLGCPRSDRRSRLTNYVLTRTTAEARPDTALVSTRGKERTMLSATLGMLPMLPAVLGIDGCAMVSR